jgi:hypothetical protein
MSPNSWIARTGQTWKLLVFYLLILATGGMLVGLIMVMNGRTFDSLGKHEFILFFVLAGICSLAWLIVSVRCSLCGSRPVWGVIKNSEVDVWLLKLHTTKSCPTCGQ